MITLKFYKHENFYIWNAISHPILKLDEHNLVTSIFLSRKIWSCFYATSWYCIALVWSLSLSSDPMLHPTIRGSNYKLLEQVVIYIWPNTTPNNKIESCKAQILKLAIHTRSNTYKMFTSSQSKNEQLHRIFQYVLHFIFILQRLTIKAEKPNRIAHFKFQPDTGIRYKKHSVVAGRRSHWLRNSCWRGIMGWWDIQDHEN